MTKLLKLKIAPLQFFLLYLLVVLHAPYYHLHNQPDNTHIPKHEHLSESAHHSADSHSHKTAINLLKAQAVEVDHKNVWHHLHFTRELYISRKNIQSNHESYNDFAFNKISPVQVYNHTFKGTLHDSLKINYRPVSSKTFSGLSPPVA